MTGSSLWLACALLLVFEGLLPFLSPSAWRSMFEQLARMSDGQIRFFGLCSIATGVAGIAVLLFF